MLGLGHAGDILAYNKIYSMHKFLLIRVRNIPYTVTLGPLNYAMPILFHQHPFTLLSIHSHPQQNCVYPLLFMFILNLSLSLMYTLTP